MAKFKEESLFSLPHVEKKDGKPYVRLNYFDERAGRWRSKMKRIHTAEDYAQALQSLKQKIGAEPSDYDPERMTFDELLAEYRKARPAMPEWYAAPLSEFFGKRRIKTITYGDLQQFRVARETVVNKATKEPRKPATINRELEWLRTVLLYAVRHEWLAKNPFNKGPESLIHKAEEESRDRIPTPEEEARILAVCVDKRAHLRPILIALRDTGLRKSALLSLTWGNVDPDGQFLLIPKGKANKGRPKVIAMTARLQAEILKLWEASDKDLKTKIFGGIKDFKRAYATACRLAGVEDLHIHDWRHGFATDLMEAGVEERLALKAAGHTNPETHSIYTNIDKRLARVISESLDRLHAEREKAGTVEVTDGTGFVS
jgi:integrase